MEFIYLRGKFLIDFVRLNNATVFLIINIQLEERAVLLHSFLFSRLQLREAFLTRLSSSLLTSSFMYSRKLLKYLFKLLSLNNTLYRLFHAVRPTYSFHINVNLILGRLVSFLSLFVSLSYQPDSFVVSEACKNHFANLRSKISFRKC